MKKMFMTATMENIRKRLPCTTHKLEVSVVARFTKGFNDMKHAMTTFSEGNNAGM